MIEQRVFGMVVIVIFAIVCQLMEKLDEVDDMRECCGTCNFNKRDFSKPQNEGYAEFCCGNEDSDNYGVPTMYDDTCEDWEEKE